MNKDAWVAWVACTVENVAAVVCFTVLAVYFGRWWIVLFAYFFTNTLTTKSTTARKVENKKNGDS